MDLVTNIKRVLLVKKLILRGLIFENFLVKILLIFDENFGLDLAVIIQKINLNLNRFFEKNQNFKKFVFLKNFEIIIFFQNFKKLKFPHFIHFFDFLKFPHFFDFLNFLINLKIPSHSLLQSHNSPSLKK